MMIGFSFISGFMIGIEYLFDDGVLVIDFGIIRCAIHRYQSGD